MFFWVFLFFWWGEGGDFKVFYKFWSSASRPGCPIFQKIDFFTNSGLPRPGQDVRFFRKLFFFFLNSGLPRPGQDVRVFRKLTFLKILTFLQKRCATSVRVICPGWRAEISHMSPKPANFVFLYFWVRRRQQHDNNNTTTLKHLNLVSPPSRG